MIGFYGIHGYDVPDYSRDFTLIGISVDFIKIFINNHPNSQGLIPIDSWSEKLNPFVASRIDRLEIKSTLHSLLPADYDFHNVPLLLVPAPATLSNMNQTIFESLSQSTQVTQPANKNRKTSKSSAKSSNKLISNEYKV